MSAREFNSGSAGWRVRLVATAMGAMFVLAMMVAPTARGQILEWVQETDDFKSGASISADGLGNVYVANYNGKQPNRDALLAKYDETGSLLWTRSYALTDDWLTGVSADGLGNVFASGYTSDPQFVALKGSSSSTTPRENWTGRSTAVAQAPFWRTDWETSMSEPPLKVPRSLRNSMPAALRSGRLRQPSTPRG